MTSPVQRARLSRFLVLSSFLVMTTGLVMFTQFHIGHGSLATEFSGLSRCTWLNVHRASAVFFCLAVASHLTVHARLFRRQALHRIGQLILLVLSCGVFITGLVAWFVLPYYLPLLVPSRHIWIDVHNLMGLALLVGSLSHLFKRARRLQVKRSR